MTTVGTNTISRSRRVAFDDRTRAIVASIAEALIPPGAVIEGGSARTVDKVEKFCGRYRLPMEKMIVGVAWALETAAMTRHAQPFSRLSREKRSALLERALREGNIAERGAIRALITPIKMAHFDDDAICRSLGVPYGVERPAQREAARWRANITDGTAVTNDADLECDVVIIGSGAGGAALAFDLASRGIGAIVVEAGGFYDRMSFNGRPTEMTRTMYLDQGLTMALGNVSIPMWAGVTVGGSTTINSGTCYRTPHAVHDEWVRDYGLRGLSADALSPYYERVEQMLEVAPGNPAHLGAIADVIGRGADALGLSHHALPRNAPGCDGRGLCVFGCPAGAKRSADVSWIPRALDRGAELWHSTRASSLIVENGRAAGVVAKSRGGAKVTIRSRAVAVACGTLQTPSFLFENRVATDNKWLGRNLSVHPVAIAFARMPERQEMWRGIPQSYTIDALRSEGIVFEGGSMPLPVAVTAIPFVGDALTSVVEDFGHMAMFGFMLKDTSRGRVFSRGLDHGPVITYRLNRHDIEQSRRAMAVLLEVFLAAGADWAVPGITGAERVRSRADVENWRASNVSPSRFEYTAYHPLGTARIGIDREHGVVGPDHECHDMPGLYVVDGAAVPSSLGVNPQMTIMAFALRAGEIIANRIDRSFS